jgi:hypothetical protein
MTSAIDTLPDELLVAILNELDFPDLLRCRGVDSRFRDCATHVLNRIEDVFRRGPFEPLNLMGPLQRNTARRVLYHPDCGQKLELVGLKIAWRSNTDMFCLSIPEEQSTNANVGLGFCRSEDLERDRVIWVRGPIRDMKNSWTLALVVAPDLIQLCGLLRERDVCHISRGLIDLEAGVSVHQSRALDRHWSFAQFARSAFAKWFGSER